MERWVYGITIIQQYLLEMVLCTALAAPNEENVHPDSSVALLLAVVQILSVYQKLLNVLPHHVQVQKISTVHVVRHLVPVAMKMTMVWLDVRMISHKKSVLREKKMVVWMVRLPKMWHVDHIHVRHKVSSPVHVSIRIRFWIIKSVDRQHQKPVLDLVVNSLQTRSVMISQTR